MITFRQFLIVLFGTAFMSAQFALPSFQAVSSKDNNKPIVTITATDGSNAVANNSTTNDATLTITFTANESITGFAIGDIGTFGGSVSSFSGSGSSYTATFTPSSARNTGIYLVKDVYTDASSNNNLASLPFYWRYDASAPTIVAGTRVANNNSTITVRLSEVVYNTNSGSGALEVGDFAFSISGGSATLASNTPSSISKATPSFAVSQIATPNGGISVRTIDLDLDNDMDFVVAAFDGDAIFWYENNGSQSFTQRTVVSSGIDAPREIWLIDLDLDGDMDIIAGIYFDEDLVWFENNGSQSFTKRTIDGSLGGKANSVLAVDLDGDSDLDIVSGTYDTSVLYWFENDGSQSFTRYTIASGLTTSPVAIDLDEDGDLDLVGRFNDGSNRIVWWENNGSESYTLNQIDNSNSGVLNVTDLDKDGDYDIITADPTNGHVNWYANNGSESFTKSTIDNSGMTSVYQVEVGDVDGDGNLDVVAQTASNDNTANDKIVWYANNGSESFTEYDVDTDLNYPYRFNLVDIDGDEDLDMVSVARDGDEVVWYENVDAGYVLGLSLSGTPSGEETVTVSPASSAIFDVAGNAASTSQSNNTGTLNDQLGPTMTITAEDGSSNAVSDGSTTNDLSLILTFTSSESTTNFVIGDVTVGGGSLISFSGSGATYTATFAPSSDGATTIDVAGGTFTDASGNNNSAATQFNWTFDSTVPTITGSSLASDNSTVAVTMSEAVYNSSNGSGSLEVSDFGFSITGGTATLASSTPSSISASGNVYTLGISLSGSASGAEQLTITPASTSIYDAAGNVASTSQSNNSVTLNDKTGPTMSIIASNGFLVIPDGSTTSNSSISIIFTSSESTSNFVVGDVTVSGGSLSSFSGTGTTYTATFTPSSDGATTIDVAGGAFTDAANNNNTAATQYNWTYDSTSPTITGTSLASDNSSVDVTFSETVYNSSFGSGSLEVGDFIFSISGGTATLSSSTPSSISVSSNTYTLGISLSGSPNGNETLTVNPVSSSIYDVAGNAASNSQSNNTVTLNAVNYVLNLNGNDEYAYYTDNANFEPANWSIQTWIDPTAVPTNSNIDYFVHKNKVYRIGLNYTASGVEVLGSLRWNGNYHDVQSGDDNFYVTAGGGWYHVLMTFDGTNLVLYVNGDEKSTNSNSNYSTNNDNTNFSIGRKDDNTFYYEGKIDEVALWNTALSSDAATALFNSGSGLDASSNSGNYTSSGNLVFYLEMQQSLNDSQGSYNFTGNNISNSDYDQTNF